MEQTRLNGQFRDYYDTGELEGVTSYKDGQIDGEYITYFENGEVKETCYLKDDQVIGEGRLYYEEGGIHRRYYSIKNQFDVPYIEYWRDGTVKWEHKANGYSLLRQLDHASVMELSD